jgi:hypothetical protein
VHQFDFCEAGGASGEANNEAVLKLAGVRPGHLLMAEWNNSIGRPCHYVAADLANHCIVVAIRCAHPITLDLSRTSFYIVQTANHCIVVPIRCAQPCRFQDRAHASLDVDAVVVCVTCY